jgi:hypothetical protein
MFRCIKSDTFPPVRRISTSTNKKHGTFGAVLSLMEYKNGFYFSILQTQTHPIPFRVKTLFQEKTIFFLKSFPLLVYPLRLWDLIFVTEVEARQPAFAYHCRF